MKKTLLLATMLTAIGSDSVIAASTPEGGQLNFYGKISTTTCSKIISSTNQPGSQQTDGDIYLDTVAPAVVSDGLQTGAPGAAPTKFSITLDCSDAADVTEATKASLKMDSNFRNSQGTLTNDISRVVSGEAAADNIAIAVHDETSGTVTQMKIDGVDAHQAQFNASKVATYNFIASYVRANASDVVTPGHVTTNATYTFTYQ